MSAASLSDETLARKSLIIILIHHLQCVFTAIDSIDIVHGISVALMQLAALSGTLFMAELNTVHSRLFR